MTGAAVNRELIPLSEMAQAWTDFVDLPPSVAEDLAAMVISGGVDAPVPTLPTAAVTPEPGPEEDKPIALNALTFHRTGDDGGESLSLDQIPAPLLSHAWADYHALAAVGSGFDPDWKKLER